MESCRGCPRILDGCSGCPRKSGLIVNKFVCEGPISMNCTCMAVLHEAAQTGLFATSICFEYCSL